MLPQQLLKNFIVSKFSGMRKRELGQTVGNVCDPLNLQFRTIPWNKIRFNMLSRMRMVSTFDRDAFEQIFTEAREIVNDHCPAFTEQCMKIHDQILEIEKSQEEDGTDTKKFLLEIAEQAKLTSETLSVETIEKQIQEIYDEHMGVLNEAVEKQFDQLKKAIEATVDRIKEVLELNYDASSETDKVASAITFAYAGIQSFIKNYIKFLEKGLGEIKLDTFKIDLAPIIKFSDDKSLFTLESYSDFYERDGRAVINEESSPEDVKNHCINILKAIRELPSRYKD